VLLRAVAPGELVILCVRSYLRYPWSYEHVAEPVAERGVEVDASCIWRWLQAYAPELNKRCRPHLKPTNKSYRIDETYGKVRGHDEYLYRAVGSIGQTIDFLLTAKRDTAAAKRFLRKAIDASDNAVRRVMNVDKNPAYQAAVEALKAEGVLPRGVALRQCKYLNNSIELDHRTAKKRVWLAKGHDSFQSASRTLQGFETVYMIREGSSEMDGKRECHRPSSLHRQVVRSCCLTELTLTTPARLSSATRTTKYRRKQ
jgi:IS6 family transposase